MLQARMTLTVAPASNQGKAVTTLIGRKLHPVVVARLASPPPANDPIKCTSPASDCPVCGSCPDTVVTMITPNVTSPHQIAIGIRHLGDPTRQALFSIWSARRSNAVKATNPYMNMAPIAEVRAKTTLCDTVGAPAPTIQVT